MKKNIRMVVGFGLLVGFLVGLFHVGFGMGPFFDRERMLEEWLKTVPPGMIVQDKGGGWGDLDRNGVLIIFDPVTGSLVYVPTSKGCPPPVSRTDLGILYLGQDHEEQELAEGFYTLRVGEDGRSVEAIDVHGSIHPGGSLRERDGYLIWSLPIGDTVFEYILAAPDDASGSKGGFAVGGFSPA